MYYLYELKDSDTTLYVVAENEKDAWCFISLRPGTTSIMRETDFILMHEGKTKDQPQLIKNYLQINQRIHVAGIAHYEYGRFSHGTMEVISSSAKIVGQYSKLYQEISI